MREVVKYGDDIDAAVELALIDLRATRDEVEDALLEEPSRGFFGIGPKLAKVKVSLKEQEPEEPEVVLPEEVPEVTETAGETVFVEEPETVTEKPARKSHSR